MARMKVWSVRKRGKIAESRVFCFWFVRQFKLRKQVIWCIHSHSITMTISFILLQVNGFCCWLVHLLKLQTTPKRVVVSTLLLAVVFSSFKLFNRKPIAPLRFLCTAYTTHTISEDLLPIAIVFPILWLCFCFQSKCLNINWIIMVFAIRSVCLLMVDDERRVCALSALCYNHI